MSSHIQKVKNNLNSIIERMSENTEKFVKNPGKDFTRKRKLSFPETLKILITMETAYQANFWSISIIVLKLLLVLRSSNNAAK
jgi:hypothetical protein